MRFDATGVGALNCDLFFKVTRKQLKMINREVDKPFILGKEDFGKPEEFESTLKIVEKHAEFIGQDLGGSAAQTIVALSRMRFRTGYFSIVGNDDCGRFLKSRLEEEGVDTSRVFTEGMKSGICISLSDGRDRALRVFPYSNDLLGLRHLDNSTLKDYLGKSELIHMTSFVCSLGYEPLEVQKKVARELGEMIKISFSPGELYANLGLETLQPIIRNTYVLFVNRREIKILTGKDYKEGSKKFSGPYYVICTLGKDGSYIRYVGSDFSTKAPTLEYIQTEGLTGAGDYFAGGFLAGLLKGKSIEECTKLGNKVACIKLRGLEREAYSRIEI